MYGAIEFPDCIQVTNDRTTLREFVYPLQQIQSSDTSLFHEQATLASRNDAVERFNDEVAEIRNTVSRDYFSLDEYLRQITGQVLAAGILKLQVGMPFMLIRNYYSKFGLCNGSRLIVTHLLNRAIKERIISQDPRFGGKEYIISRASMTSREDVSFTMVRKQLPLRPCFSMTINKSQGQTLKQVGVDLSTSTFTPWQLYAALSRVTDVRNMIVLLPLEQRTTDNVVYPEVLLRPPMINPETVPLWPVTIPRTRALLIENDGAPEQLRPFGYLSSLESEQIW
ncbi:hypothetical protein EPUL_002350 [Erysiphe pulchra]|uniref:DNA helicase Pif1-like 2B domain-containing protein n=1 Tax=Erysiphe pulchra TaxID=225359 RepID=A0A2S4PQD7_9PEZI|nr:hypothetical protein EPUL_002350 [Erysiphe pulchra]